MTAKSLGDMLKNCASQDKISLPNKRIGSIGDIPQRFASITSLDLSYNCLHSLEGIEQLPKLQSLQLSHNNLCEIRSLYSLKQLKVLYLAGNAVTTDALYKEKLIASLPSLERLDSRRVTDRKLPKLSVETAQAMNDNEITCIKLESLKGKLRMHRQLIICNFITAYKELSVKRYLALLPFAYSEDLAAEIEEWVCRHSQDEWALALIDQENRISELKLTCENLAVECYSLFKGKQGDVIGPIRCVESPVMKKSIDQQFSFIQNSYEDTLAIHTAISEGLSIVIERFKTVHLLKRVFQAFRKATDRQVLIRSGLEHIRLRKVKRIFGKWKNARPSTLIDSSEDEIINENEGTKLYLGRNRAKNREKLNGYHFNGLENTILSRKCEYRRLLRYATFHRNKKMKIKVLFYLKSLWLKQNSPAKVNKDPSSEFKTVEDYAENFSRKMERSPVYQRRRIPRRPLDLRYRSFDFETNFQTTRLVDQVYEKIGVIQRKLYVKPTFY